ncbi:PRAME family member 6-like [Echinops telfairi]|uniref:PRAME family member 6-like n=1 Tax=Echinops telfairi TaxID=9371 RepID=A0AC55CRE9_ECHTE|nr:PRAME family member 6-like [Echinops telfairi]
MSSRNPPRLLDLAIQSVLQDEPSAIAALEWLPTQLFPPLFMAAVIGGHRETVKAMWHSQKTPLQISECRDKQRGSPRSLSRALPLSIHRSGLPLERLISMSSRNPPRLLDLAIQSVLQDENSAIAALEWLPTQLFPPLFMAAVVGGRRETVKAMVGCWPFIGLPLGALVKSGHSDQDILHAALDGFHVLLTQKLPPRRCRLRALDVRLDTDTNFWKVWSGNESIASVPSSEDPVTTQPRTRTQKGKDSRAGEKPQSSTSMVLLTDLRFLDTAPDELFTVLMERVKQGKDLPPLCCRKVEIVGGLSELPVIEKILNVVQRDAVQEVAFHCWWNLKSLNWFAPFLSQMGHLSTLHLSRISLDSLGSRTVDKVAKLLAKLTSHLLSLHQLQHLILETVFFLNDHLCQLLSCLPTTLESLTLKYCVPLDADLSSLHSCPSTRQLRSLDLSGMFRARSMRAYLPKLLERVSATLTHLSLTDCGINDSELTALQPALGHCSQLSTLLLGGNPVSMAVLQGLLQHTWPLCKFSLLGLPVPQDCYEDPEGFLHEDTFLEVIRQLRVTLQAYRPLSVSFVPSTCDRTWDEILLRMDS